MPVNPLRLMAAANTVVPILVTLPAKGIAGTSFRVHTHVKVILDSHHELPGLEKKTQCTH